MINAGAELTFYATGTGGGLFAYPRTPAQLRSEVTKTIEMNGLRISDFSLTDDDDPLSTDFHYSARVTVRTIGAHGALEDVAAIVRGGFWTVTGYAPIVTSERQADIPAPASWLPNFNLSLGLVAVIVLGALAVFVKVKP